MVDSEWVDGRRLLKKKKRFSYLRASLSMLFKCGRDPYKMGGFLEIIVVSEVVAETKMDDFLTSSL